jgi:transcriptional regulator with XRE-family HTH domain
MNNCARNISLRALRAQFLIAKIITMIGERLREARERNGYTQEQMAKLLNIKRQTYSAYECGVNLPNVEMLSAISDHLCVSLDFLAGKTDAYARQEEGKQMSQEDYIDAMPGLTRSGREYMKQQLALITEYERKGV